MLTVENNSSMQADHITTKEISNKNLIAKNLITKFTTVENIKSAKANNLVKVIF